MIPAARLTPLAIASTLLSVSVVPAFPQSNLSVAASSRERSSWTAARQYDPAYAFPKHIARPTNLIVTPALTPVVETMLQRSRLFRRQCARIAAAPNLTVRIAQAGSLPPGVRARTRFSAKGPQLGALVEIPVGYDQVELIAHEIEHVVEQLDGIDLRAHAARSDSGVHATAPHLSGFETRRAHRVGLLVAQEVRAWQASALSPSRR
jgi:hypothetical protein